MSRQSFRRAYFPQWVPEAGFCWIRAKDADSDKPGQFLAQRAAHAGAIGGSVYDPFSDRTGLFRDFGNVPLTPAGILEFANKYGSLGMPKSTDPEELPKMPVMGFGGTIAGTNRSVPAEPLHAWVNEIRAMKEAIEIWDAVTHQRAGKLSDIVVWRETSGGWSVTVNTGRMTHAVAGQRYHSDILQEMKPGDLLMPAKYYLQWVVNDALLRHTVSARMLWNRRQKLDVLMGPKGLIGALWLQLAFAIEGDRSYQTCEQCRRWFEIGAEVRRGAKFCSEACRQKHKRARIAAARTLYADKVSVREIASRLKTNVATVKGWVQ